MAFIMTLESTDKSFGASFNSGGDFSASFAADQTVNISSIVSNTTAGWDSQRDLIGKKDVLYVYTDHQAEEDGEGNITYIPGCKIGDGKAYLIDLPFLNQVEMEHIHDLSIHITQAEREFWNNKVRAYYSEVHDDTLVFTIH